MDGLQLITGACRPKYSSAKRRPCLPSCLHIVFCEYQAGDCWVGVITVGCQPGQLKKCTVSQQLKLVRRGDKSGLVAPDLGHDLVAGNRRDIETLGGLQEGEGADQQNSGQQPCVDHSQTLNFGSDLTLPRSRPEEQNAVLNNGGIGYRALPLSQVVYGKLAYSKLTCWGIAQLPFKSRAADG